MPTEIQLQEPDRQRLDGIVQKMVANNEPDENIQLVVDDFKQKYGKPKENWYVSGVKKAANPGLLLGPLGQLATSKGREQVKEGAKALIGSTANLAARSGLSFAKGVTGLAGLDMVPDNGVNIPGLGQVKPFATKQSAPVLAYAKNKGLNVTPEMVSESKAYTNKQALDDALTAATAYLEAGAPGASSLVKKPFTLLAEKLYQSALKPSKTFGPEVVKNIVKTGLEEKVWLTKGGVENMANKINMFESQIGDAIEAGKANGVKISTEGLQKYVDEAKDFFKYDVDTEAAKKAVKELDDLVKNFKKTYGEEIPIEVAQKIKVKTGQQLKKYYDRLTSVGVEGRKQVTRFLKDKIVEKAPIVGDANKRLQALYDLDKALDSASTRIGNLNIFSLGGKIMTGVGATAGGLKGAALGAVGSILSGPAAKSGLAIGLDLLGKSAGATATGSIRVPVTASLNKALEGSRAGTFIRP